MKADGVYYVRIVYAESLLYHFSGDLAVGKVGVIQVFFVQAKVGNVIIEHADRSSPVQVMQQLSELC